MHHPMGRAARRAAYWICTKAQSRALVHAVTTLLGLPVANWAAAAVKDRRSLKAMRLQG